MCLAWHPVPKSNAALPLRFGMNGSQAEVSYSLSLRGGPTDSRHGDRPSHTSEASRAML